MAEEWAAALPATDAVRAPGAGGLAPPLGGAAGEHVIEEELHDPLGEES